MITRKLKVCCRWIMTCCYGIASYSYAYGAHLYFEDDPDSLTGVGHNVAAASYPIIQLFQTMSLLGGLILVLSAYMSFKKRRGIPEIEVTPIIVLLLTGLIAVGLYFIPISHSFKTIVANPQ